MTGSGRPRVLLVVGYFDWFSGYQETALAAALATRAATEVVASDRVNPAFSDEHLGRIGVDRRYALGSTQENGLRVTRFRSRELRSMVWSGEVRNHIDVGRYDLIVQVMPGQGLPVAASLSSNPAPRVVLYGDNRAMWSGLSRRQQLAKTLAFGVSKGLAYAFVNSRADQLYGYTQDTLDRLRRYRAGKSFDVLPLTFDANRYYFDEDLRYGSRCDLGLSPSDMVVLAAGKYSPTKRLDWTLEAFREVAAH